MVIKLAGNYPQLYFDHAYFDARGTEEEPIIITSYYDDSAGGDTDGDGGARQPQTGDWYRASIMTEQTTEMEHVEFRYGRYCLGLAVDYNVRNNKFKNCSIGLGVYAPGFNSTIEGNSFENNGTGVEILSGGKYYNNFFTGNQTGIGLVGTSDEAAEITYNELTGNRIGIGFGNYPNAVITNNNIYGNNIGGINFGEAANVFNNWWGDPSGPYHYWGNPQGKGNGLDANFYFSPWLVAPVERPSNKLTPVIIVPGILGSAAKDGRWELDPILHTYDNLVDTFLANGYEEGVTLFKFPYDWRQSNEITAIWLEAKIQEAKHNCDCDQVDIVAHSMGGLVARQYIQSDRYKDDVRKLIFLGTPHLGAPKAYLSWEAGEVPSRGVADQLFKILMDSQAKKEKYFSIFEYVRKHPLDSVKQLLPTFDYLIEKSDLSLRVYPNNYPRNFFLENLNNSSAKLFNQNINISNIVGLVKENGETISKYLVVTSPNNYWEDGFPDDFYGNKSGVIYGPGDNTVPFSSANFINSNITILDADHNELPDEAQTLVFKEIYGAPPLMLIKNKKRPNVILYLRMLSPADMVVVSPDGKKVGKNFNSESEINEIEGAFYSGFLTDDEYITIPDPINGEYKIYTQGTGNGGSYTVATGLISDDLYLEDNFTASTVPGLVTEVKLTVNYSVGELASVSADKTSPVIEIFSPVSRDYLHSETIEISKTVTDEGVGLLSQETYSDGIIKEEGSIDLFFEQLGDHKLTVKAKDYVGNQSEKEVAFRIIATRESAILDIERAYSLGWIDNKGVKNSLIAKLKNNKDNYEALLNELEAQRGKHINKTAYQLIYRNIKWLIEN